jgi:hypothetical protein
MSERSPADYIRSRQNSGDNGFASNWIYSKKKQYLYKERKEDKRRKFVEALAAIPVDDRVYYDESGMDNNERQAYGWGKGSRVYDEKPGFSSQRMSILASLNCRTLCAPIIFEGYRTYA